MTAEPSSLSTETGLEATPLRIDLRPWRRVLSNVQMRARVGKKIPHAEHYALCWHVI